MSAWPLQYLYKISKTRVISVCPNICECSCNQFITGDLSAWRNLPNYFTLWAKWGSEVVIAFWISFIFGNITKV